MANYVYPSGQNLINMDQAHIYGGKSIAMDSYNHYNMGVLECKLTQDNYMPNSFTGFYTESETQHFNIPEVIPEIKHEAKICKINENAAKNVNVKLPSEKKSQFKKVNGLFHCDLCNYSSLKISSVKSHLMVHTGERPFKCDLCTKSFRQKEHLKNHRLTHTKEKLFFCNECSYSCGVRGSMDLHKLIHKGIKPYVCMRCDYRCRRPFEMRKHRIKCESVLKQCNLCHKIFSKRNSLALHKITHLEYLKFSCKLCEYTAKLRSRFKSHLEKMHPEKTFSICHSCDFFCTKKKTFKDHKLTHDDKRKWFKCESCIYSSSTKSALKEHVLTHADDEIETDDKKESNSTIDEESLQENVEKTNETSNEIHSNNFNPKNLDIEQSNTNNLLENSQYPKCDNIIMNGSCVSNENSADLLQNVPGDQNDENSGIKSVNRLFYCDVCEFSSRRLSSVRVHKYLHTGERPFLCDVCPASYTRRQHLQKHKLLHAQGKDTKVSKAMKIYTCSECSFSCAHKGNLQKHQLLHAGKDPNCENRAAAVRAKKFPCNICKLKFSLESQMIKHLKQHIEKAHTGGFEFDPTSSKSLLDQFNEFTQLNCMIRLGNESNERLKDICKKIDDLYCCNLCDFTTKRLNSIKVHYFMHTGEKPYKCDQCSASYRRKQHLQNHRVRHLKELIYLCHLCDFKCSQKSQMEEHRVTHEDENVCDKCNFSCSDLLELGEHKANCVELICSRCAEIFLDQIRLDEHERSHDRKDLKPEVFVPSPDESSSETLLSKLSTSKVKTESKPPYINFEEILKPPPEVTELIKNEEVFLDNCSGSHFSYTMGDRMDDFGDSSGNEKEVLPKEIKIEEKEKIKQKKKKHKHKKKEHKSKKFKRNQHLRINGLYCCEFCNYSNKRLNSIKVHRMIHTGERPFLCDVCSATFRQKEHLINHKNTHSTEKTFSCEKCGFTSKRKIGLVKHLLLHREKSFVCVKCGYRCRVKSILDKHEIKCKDSKIKCNQCEETFSLQSELVSHRALHIELKTYSCELCDFTASNLLYLKKHTLKHSKVLYLCYICSFMTVHKTNMQKHRLTHNEKYDASSSQPRETPAIHSQFDLTENHRSIKPAVGQTETVLPLMHQVDQNLQGTSQNITGPSMLDRAKMDMMMYDAFYERPPQPEAKPQGRPKKFKSGEFKKENDLYFCDFCDYSNTRVNSVKVHRMIHTNERPFSCDLCPKSFRQKMHLRNHKITHTKEKLFFCNECTFSCGYKASLDLHKLKHTGVKPYVCEKCLYSCRRPVEMEKHKRVCGVSKGS